MTLIHLGDCGSRRPFACPSRSQSQSCCAFADSPAGKNTTTTISRWARLAFTTAVLAGGGRAIAQPRSPEPTSTPDVAELKRLTGRLAPIELSVDVSRLPPGERAALGALVDAARELDPLFQRQVWAGNSRTLLELAADASPLGRERLHAFRQNQGPWLRLDGDRPFLPGIGAKPPAANFYPADASKSEVEAWMHRLPGPARTAAEGFFTTIRRAPDRTLQIVPYSIEYQGELARAATHLREAAALTAQPTLRTYLEARAAALLSNDYVASDVAWMRLDASIEPTIGPYEVYEDGWFSAKASFEAFVTVRDDVETAKLTRFATELQDIEDHLPIAPALRNPHLGALAPIRVVNTLFSSGDGNRGVQTAAFNLPNDERVARDMGTKRTMLKNVQEAKFRTILLPIAAIALAPRDRKNVAFDAFFTHILMHELAHGLGPHEVSASAQVAGTGSGGAGGTGTKPPPARVVTVRAALQDAYGPIEEAKADIAGLYALQYLIDKGVLDRAMERTIYVTFLASALRSIRFGLGEAHGKGIALQLGALLDAGAVRVAADGTLSVDVGKMKGAVRALTGTLMFIQATGDRAWAAELLRTRAVVRPEIATILARLGKIPIDIEPRFVTAERLLAERRASARAPASASGDAR